jgi:hypothetical protein
MTKNHTEAKSNNCAASFRDFPTKPKTNEEPALEPVFCCLRFLIGARLAKKEVPEQAQTDATGLAAVQLKLAPDELTIDLELQLLATPDA